MIDKYAAMTAHAARYPVQLMCAALDVSASGYYASVQRVTAAPTARATTQARRRVLVLTIFLRCRQHYSAPRPVRELREAEHRIAKESVARILRDEEGIQARRPTSIVRTTDSAHTEPIADNTRLAHTGRGTRSVPENAIARQCCHDQLNLTSTRAKPTAPC